MTEWIYDQRAGRCRKTDGGQAVSDDRIAEIYKRHAFADENKSVIRPTGFSWTIPGWQAHNDRAWLLAEVERLRAEMQSAKADAWDEGYQDHQEMIEGIARKPSNPYR